ncbi:YdaS family helix-turn-helix protein [Stenotrophomonas sp. VV52]|uniref:transcriptional regulator n=1 Tax=Stenotrophomonas sp. VV52 TaxID=2066958 RepID=UPI000C9DCDB0|nr:YdaS family helix-turn-helix protein [Stenotrophomonas sp. VV52]
MDALDKAVKAAGGVTSLADSLGVVQSTVSNWRKRRRVPPGHVIRIEGVTGVSRHELCPEVFGPANGQASGGQGAVAGRVLESTVTKRALRSRLGLSSDAHLAKVLQLPVKQVEAWPDEQGVPALPKVLQLLGVQEEQPAALAAPNDPDADRVIQVQVA